jgi:hypothetical protein
MASPPVSPSAPPAVPPRRRGCLARLIRALLIAVVLLVVAVALTWWLAAPIALRHAAQRALPVDLGDGWTAQRLLDAPVDADLAVRLGIPRARALTRAATGWWIPPGALRDGQTLLGTVALDTGAKNLPAPLSWRVALGGDDPPEIHLRLDANRADALLAPYAAVDGNGFRFAFVVAKARLDPLPAAATDAPAKPGSLRWTLAADGAIQLTIAGATTAVPAHLDAHLEAIVRPKADGLAPALQVTIDRITTPDTDLPLLTSPATCRHLQDLANAEIALQLQGTVLPAWTPTDAVITGEVVPP